MLDLPGGNLWTIWVLSILKQASGTVHRQNKMHVDCQEVLLLSNLETLDEKDHAGYEVSKNILWQYLWGHVWMGLDNNGKDYDGLVWP